MLGFNCSVLDVLGQGFFWYVTLNCYQLAIPNIPLKHQEPQP